MAAHAIASGTISFGLVSIPVKFYASTSDHQLAFHMLHKTCGTRVKMQLYCPHDKEVISRKDTVKGYEHAKDQFVQFTKEELEKLEGERSDRLDIIEFVPEESVDQNYIESTQYLGPAKGGDRAYKLLSDAMERTGRVAVGRYGARGREQLVLLRPYKGGIVMHQVYYADEVRSMEDVDYPRKMTFRDLEAELADRLIEQLSVDGFDLTKHRDEYRERVMNAVEEKVLGKEVPSVPQAPQAQIIDLFEALKRSLGDKAPKHAAKRDGRSEPPQVTEEEEQAEVAAEASEMPKKPISKARSRRKPAADKTGTD